MKKCFIALMMLSVAWSVYADPGHFDQAIFENRRAKKSVRSGATELFFGEVYF